MTELFPAWALPSSQRTGAPALSRAFSISAWIDASSACGARMLRTKRIHLEFGMLEFITFAAKPQAANG